MRRLLACAALILFTGLGCGGPKDVIPKDPPKAPDFKPGTGGAQPDPGAGADPKAQGEKKSAAQ
jgi:hypothetical protein